MNARICVLVSLLAVLVLSACAPAATPQAIATAPRQNESRPAQEARPAPTRAAAPTQAPQPTQVILAPAATAAIPAPNNGADNYFQDPGVNAPEKAAQDHLSTFSLDVDTASYTLARRYVDEGTLPPMDEVRVEEFVNAFDQGYRAPRDAAFTIFADGAPTPFTSGGKLLVRFGVQGYRVSDTRRKPLHLTYVIDTSGSMNMESRIGLVKNSLDQLADQLDERDWVAIIAFNTSAREILAPVNGADHAAIKRAVDRLRPGGSTNADAGLRLGYDAALRMFDPEATNRVILCSDGVANVGNVDADSILDFVHGYVERGITLTSIGVGMGNYNDVLLEQLADRGNGNYHYVDTSEQAHKIFVEDMLKTLQVIAYDAKVQVDFNTDVVAAYRQIGYENRTVADQDFRNDSVDAGEIGAGASATALYEVQLKPGAEGRIATFQLRWKDADTRQDREINGNYNTWDVTGSFEATDPHFQLSAAVAAYAEVLRYSPYVDASLDEIAFYARKIANCMPGNTQAADFAGMAERSAKIGMGGE